MVHFLVLIYLISKKKPFEARFTFFIPIFLFFKFYFSIFKKYFKGSFVFVF